MEALVYLFKKTLKNRVKTAVKKPVTYFWLFFILMYGVFLPYGMNKILVKYNLATPQGMTLLVTIFCFWLIPANIISYSKRKGLLFKKADINLMFVTPISPKRMLINTHMKTLTTYFLFSIIILIAGFIMFKLSPLNMFLFFVATMIIENILETSIMLICYGSEKLTEQGRKVLVIISYAIMLSFVAIGVVVYLKQGLNFESVLYFLNCDAIQIVPLVGWDIAFMRLIFMGPTTLNIICSSLYLVSTFALLLIAWNMKCTGEFFEDAEKFADDYEEMKKKSAEGTAARFGKKEKYREAKVTYKGSGAKAIFYKQLLEYKKSKSMLLDKTNLVMVVVGNIWIYMSIKDIDGNPFKVFIMPAIMAYLVICTSAVNGKWGKEIKSPYTFLIPDSAVKKLWYATVMEHVKNLVYGVLFAVPCAVMLKVTPLQTILCIIVYMMMQANKLYSLVMMEALVGSTLGRVGKQLFHMFLQGIPMLIAGGSVAIVGIMSGSIELAYILMISVLAACVVVFMIFAAFSFEKMETV